MKKRAVLLSVVLCLFFTLIICPCWSQRRRSQPIRRPPQDRDFQRRVEQQRLDNQRRLENRRRSEEFKKITDEYENEVYQEVLGADEDQWKLIKPRLKRVDELRMMPALRFSVYGAAAGASGGSGSSSSYRSGNSGGGRSGYSSGGSSGGGSSQSSQQGYGGGTGGGQGGGHSAAGTGTSRGSAGGASGGGGGTSYNFGGGAEGGPARPVKKQVGELSLGWTWHRPSEEKNADELTEVDKVCEQLLDAIEAENPDRTLTQKRLEQLRQIRRQKLRQLEEAQQQLREVVTPDQQVRLILMGYLDE